LFDHDDFGLGQRLHPDELAVRRAGLPRWHQTTTGDLRHLGGALAGGVVGDQAERRRAIRTMAVAAVAVDDRRDVFVEGDRRRLRPGIGRHSCGQCNTQRD
jgi:hypothetical protein